MDPSERARDPNASTLSAAIAATFFALTPAASRAARPAPLTASARAAVEVHPTDRVPTGLSTNPVTFNDCMGNGDDCCNALCKVGITGCCVKNSCGLPVVDVVKGKGPWAGQARSCSNMVD